MSIETCPLTGFPINLRQDDPNRLSFSYETPRTKLVKFTDVAYMEARSLAEDEKLILAGIARNNAESNIPAFEFTAAFLKQLKSQPIPYSFEDRARHFLRYLYDRGGKQYKQFDIDPVNDSPIAYASGEEFERMIVYLEDEGWINTGHQYIGGEYHGLKITKEGIREVEKGQPKMPMVGLVNQKITTGDVSIDGTIEQARKAFFDDPTSFESKRSACETLSFVLEPLRKELDGMFEGDTEVFFRIVNDFSVRHNKPSTKRINHEEQLEWIFYSLLNTINTYYKMRRKTI
jgi:hypothetical protein